MKYQEKKLSGKMVYEGKILKVRVDEVSLVNGRTAVREVMMHPGGVAVVPLLPDGGVICVRQFRYPMGQDVLEVPAGKLDRGEEPLAGAKRELEEETGYTAKEYVYLGEFYPSPGFCDEVLHIYLATGLEKGQAHPDEDEFLDVEKISLEELAGMIGRNELPDGKTVAAVLKAKMYLEGGK